MSTVNGDSGWVCTHALRMNRGIFEAKPAAAPAASAVTGDAKSVKSPSDVPCTGFVRDVPKPTEKQPQVSAGLFKGPTCNPR